MTPLKWLGIEAVVLGLSGCIFYQTDEIDEAAPVEVANKATIAALKQKCGGSSYRVIVEDFPGRIELNYSAPDIFVVSLGLSAEGVNECETYQNGSCLKYKSDFTPPKSVYVDTNGNGLVDLVIDYKQDREGNEELIAARQHVTLQENEKYLRQLRFFEKVQPTTTSSLVKVAPCQ